MSYIFPLKRVVVHGGNGRCLFFRRLVLRCRLGAEEDGEKLVALSAHLFLLLDGFDGGHVGISHGADHASSF